MINLGALDTLVRRHLRFQLSVTRSFKRHHLSHRHPSSVGRPSHRARAGDERSAAEAEEDEEEKEEKEKEGKEKKEKEEIEEDEEDEEEDAKTFAALLSLRNHLLNGRLDEAAAVCRRVCPRASEDVHLQLHVRLHTLLERIHDIEGLRSCLDEDNEKEVTGACHDALEYAQELATFALDAFPEAYTMFVKGMSLFVDTGDKAGCKTFVRRRRAELADCLVASVRVWVCGGHSQLELVMRYLGLIYVNLRGPVVWEEMEACMVHGVLHGLFWGKGRGDSGTREKNEGDEGISWSVEPEPMGQIPPESGRGFDEADVQMLPERVGISRQQAVKALRFANGNVVRAVKNEVGRVRVSPQALQELVVEYAVARGLDDVVETVGGVGWCEREEGVGGVEVSEEVAEYLVGGSDDGERVEVLEGEVGERFVKMGEVMRDLRKGCLEERDGAVLEGLQRAAKKGGVDSVGGIQFKLLQRRVLLCVREREFDRALEVVRGELAPLVSGWRDGETGEMETLRKMVGDTMVVVCCGGVCEKEASVEQVTRSVQRHCAAETIAKDVFDAMVRRVGEPRLVSVMRELVEGHAVWEAANMMSDGLARAMGVALLTGEEDAEDDGETGHADGRARVRKRQGVDNDASVGEAQRAQSGRRQDEAEDADSKMAEDIVLTLMEFLAISRADALLLIREHPHARNAQTILEALL